MRKKRLIMQVVSGFFMMMSLLLFIPPSHGEERSLNGYENWSDLVAYFPSPGNPDIAGLYCLNGNNNLWKKIFTDKIDRSALGDLNGDKADELVYAQGNNVFVYDLITKKKTVISNPTGSSILLALTVGDYNHDGKEDIITSWKDTGLWWCDFADNGKQTNFSGSIADMATAGDYNGDGYIDFLFRFKNAAKGIMYWDGKNQTWVKLELKADLVASLSCVASGDLNGDKRSEWIGSFSNGVWSYDFISKNWTQYHKKQAALISTGDMDGDKKDDLLGIWPNVEAFWILYSKSNTWAKLHKEQPSCFAAGMVYRSDLPPEYYFSNVRKMPFIGGSLMYNGNDPSLSHVKEKIYIPLKLGKFQKVAVENPDIEEAGSDTTEFQDVEKETLYGLLRIDAVNSSSISLGVVRWDYQGNQLRELLVSLFIGQEADLNADGKPDIRYTRSIRDSRMTDENVAYLQFISSEAELRATYYNYAPDLHPELNKAGGNFGFNANGYALIRKDFMPASTGTYFDGQTLLQVRDMLNRFIVSAGDFIVDPDKGYLKIASIDYGKQTMLLADPPATEDGLQETAMEALVMLAYDMDEDDDYQTPYNGPPSYGANSAATLEEYQTKRDQLYNKFDSCDKKFTLLNINNLDLDYSDSQGKVATCSIEKLHVGVGGGIKVRIGFLKIKAWHTTMSISESIYSLKVNRTFKLEKELVSVKPFYEEIPIKLGPIILDFYVGCSAGVKAGIDARDLGYYKFAKTTLKGNNGYFRAGLFYLKNDNNKFDETIAYLGDGATNEKIVFYFQPYVETKVGIKAFKAAYAELCWEGYLKSATTFYLNPEYNIACQYALSVGHDIDFVFGIKIGGFNPHHHCHLIDVEGVILEKTWTRPSAVKPDLLISKIRFDPEDPKPGTSLELFATIQNLGLLKVTSGQNIIVKLKNEDTGAAIGQFTLKDGLEKGQEIEGKCNTVFQIPSDADHLSIKVDVDPGGLISELNENNNSLKKSIQLVKRPDLVTTQISAYSDANPIIPGKPIYLWATVKNQGNSATPGTTGSSTTTPVSVGFYLVQGNQLIFIGKGTVVGPNNKDPDVDVPYPLGPGGVAELQCEQTWTPSAPGVYKIAAMVDYQGKITEENENNNWRELQVTVTATPPDLTQTNMMLVPTDQDFYHIKGTIANNGFSKASDIVVHLYEIVNNQEKLLDTLTINQIDLNSKVDATFDCDIFLPSGDRSPPGPSIKLKVVIDPDNKIAESNESNNTKTYTFSF